MFSQLQKYLLHRLIKSHWMRIGEFRQYAPRKSEMNTLSHQRGRRSEPYLGFAVVTPSFNQAPFIQETIDSVRLQDYPNLSYAVIDGGSTDGSVALIESNKQAIDYWVSEVDEGQAHAINKGFSEVDGEIMAYLNSDDLYTAGTFHFINNFFQENPEVDVVYGNRIIINEQGDETARWVLPDHDNETLRWVDYVPQETLFWRRRVWDAVGGIDASFHFAMDWDLLLRFQGCGAKILHLPHYLACFRVHDAQKTSKDIHTGGAVEMDRLRSREHGREVSWDEIHSVNDSARFKAYLASIKMHYGFR